MTVKGKNLLLSLALCLSFALIGGLLTGDALEGWFQYLNQPWYALPLWGWYIVGGLYYGITFTLLYRVFNLPQSKQRKKALILTLAMMAGNEAWNYLFFGLESTFAAFVSILPFAVLVCILFFVLYRYERTSAWILLPYVLWLGYDILWTYGLWQLNP